MEIIRSANLALRFLLELMALGAVGYWGFTLDRPAMRWLVGLGAPLVLFAVWSIVVAPGAPNGLSPTTKMWMGTVILALSAAAVGAANRPALAVTLVVATVANAVLLQIWLH